MLKDGDWLVRPVGKGEVLVQPAPRGGPQSFAAKAFLQEDRTRTECVRFVRRHSQRSINKPQLAETVAQATPNLDAAHVNRIPVANTSHM